MPDEKTNTGATRLPMALSSLQFLEGDLGTADQFSELYERMLNDAKLRRDLTLVRRMQKLLMRQSRFLVREYKAAGGKYAFEYHEGPEPGGKAKAEGPTIQ